MRHSNLRAGADIYVDGRQSVLTLANYTSSLQFVEGGSHSFINLKNFTVCKPSSKLIFVSVSTPAIAGIVVFAVVFVSVTLMFIFYRRRSSKNRSSKCRRSSPAQAVKHSPITVETSTYQLTSARPIPAAPDYGKFGLGRRSSNNNMLDNSSSEEESFDAEELGQKFDWSSSPGGRRKNFLSNGESDNIPDGMLQNSTCGQCR